MLKQQQINYLHQFGIFNEDMIDIIITGQLKLFEKYGDFYCPCKEYREEKKCHCGVFKE